MLPMAVAMSFSGGVLIHYILPVLWMASCVYTMAYAAFISYDRTRQAIQPRFQPDLVQR